MNTFSAEGFFKLGQDLQRLRVAASEVQKEFPGGMIDDGIRQSVMPYLESALNLASQVGLKISMKWIAETMLAVKAEKCSLGGMKNHVWAMASTVEKEMDGQLFLYVPATRSDFYEKDAADFLGGHCRDRFPSVLPEFDEAMKCYAVGRYTACAFHLMRATEAGTKALGISIGAKAGNNNWGEVFREYDKQILMTPSARPSHWASHGEFLAEIGANLRAVKTLRNGISHLDESYTEERAEKLMVLVPAFLRQLAEKMDEKGTLL